MGLEWTGSSTVTLSFSMFHSSTVKTYLFQFSIILWSSTLVVVLQSFDLWSFLLHCTEAFGFQFSLLVWESVSLFAGLSYRFSSRGIGFLSVQSLMSL